MDSHFCTRQAVLEPAHVGRLCTCGEFHDDDDDGNDDDDADGDDDGASCTCGEFLWTRPELSTAGVQDAPKGKCGG
jgi:hypothetical protein